ncbi:transcriptional regulator, TetR family [Aeromicrobium marinum DSM 15272]|uniref:Transcriptional regulator, TetR family n=1 Tax=Aeromicrobium marinum DSM 15272 TaxID=585531 RepID=E2SC61_9ACTN|nr:transcriptional regulator, TetR family [Aeromicrobium marinum DSM 15272]
MTRAERQAQTRERLVEVARELFLDEGYAATSLDKVALAAGFSKGAVYSNFAGKEELCLAVLDSIHEEQIEGVLGAFTTDTDLAGRIDAFAAWAQTGLGHPRWTALEVEFAAVARHSPFVATELVKRHRDLVAATAQLIGQVTREAGLELRVPAHEAATVLLSLGIGLGALRSLDSAIDVTIFADAMRALAPGFTAGAQ